ncbi:hypothetical protein BDZ91DRAFT_673360 [Kalaharituber pfeilii]|nr:hypothetical protein BDZ91DRAFT_673360 [Kalaharituber pfeilii]
MDGSSPLAALQPRTLSPSFGMSPYSKPRASRSLKLGISKPVAKENIPEFERLTDKSSPTTCLVADLSESFYIDKTPQVPTPRKALFTSFTFAGRDKSLAGLMSSPSVNGIDSSTLSNKPAFASLYTESPTISPTTDSPLSNKLCASPLVEKESTPCSLEMALRKPVVVERKKSNSLQRQPFRSKSGNIFKTTERGGLSRAKSMALLDLEEIFKTASPPPKEEKAISLGPAFSPLSTPKPPKFPVPERCENSVDGSPVAAIQRRPNVRPKLKMRRTMSMIEKPEDAMPPADKIMTPKLAPITDILANSSPGESHILPCFTVKDDSLRRIKKSILLDVLDDKYKDQYDQHIIIDCRFDYEYQGGHVAGAININTPEALEERFFENLEPEKAGKTLIIFHCEYSAVRAPQMAMHFRRRDRQLNMHRYPALSYPDVYILEGGYSGFFKEFRERCEPQHYVEMDDASHRQARERELGKFRRHAKLGRSQTYTFGDNLNASPSGNLGKRSLSYSNDGTPTARSRPGQRRSLQ